MRIAIAAEHQVLGAAEAYALNLSAGLADRGHQVSVLVHPELEREVARRLRPHEVEVLGAAADGASGLETTCSLIRRLRPQVVHVNRHASSVLIAAWASRVPVRAVTDHMLPAAPRFNLSGTALQSLARRAANLLVVFSRQNALAAHRSWGALHPTVIYPGVPLPPCDEPRDAVRERLGLEGRHRVACTVGRLSPEKRQDVFVRAVGLAHQRNPAIRGLVLGEGPERKSLEALIERLGLRDVVTLLGYRDDVGCCLRASDLYVHCSDREGLGIAIVEAMAVGLPVIVSDLPAHREVAGDAPVPIVPVGDRRALADRILQHSPGTAEDVGEALRARWKETFTMEGMVRSHEALYRQALERSRSERREGSHERMRARRPPQR